MRELSTQNIQLGDVFDLTIQTSSNSVVFPSADAFENSDIGYFGKEEILSSTSSKVVYHLSAYKIDGCVIPTMTYYVSGNAVILPAYPLKIQSAFAKTETQKLQGLKPQMEVPLNYFVLFFWLVLIAAIVWLFFWIKQKLEQPKVIIAKEQLENAYDRAIRKLAQLNASDLLAKAQFNLFYAELTSIIKEYLSVVVSINIVELTTFEIKKALKDKLDEQEYKDALNFFQKADLVKFAKNIPSKNEIAGILQVAEELIYKHKALFTLSLRERVDAERPGEGLVAEAEGSGGLPLDGTNESEAEGS